VAPEDPLHPRRIVSIDLLRGLDVLLMLFVNEVAGVRDAPAFLRHASPVADAMTITDVVFPAFLFIVGMAIPFALDGRLRRGETKREVGRHVLLRTIALLVIGVLMVNVEMAGPGGPLPIAIWNILMTVAVVLMWAEPPADAAARRRQRLLRIVGVALLSILVFTYRGTDLTGLIQLRPHWWGILGLIGWAYLLVAGLYLLVGDRPAILTGVMALLYCLYLADAAGQAAVLVALRPYLSVGSVLGSHGAVVLSGTILSVMLRLHQRDGAPAGRFVGPALTYAAGLAAAGLLLHTLSALDPAFRFSKVHATPPWCLVSSALTAAAWAAVYAVADVRGLRRWPPAVLMAGENALVAYLLAPFLLSLFEASAPLFGGTNFYETLAENTAVGLVRSAVFAWLVVRLCGLLRGAGLRMQL
jgi:heparan-alpha-glucosaminide N-acetyltransferase